MYRWVRVGSKPQRSHPLYLPLIKEDGLFNPCPTPRLSSVLDTRMFTNKIWGFNLLYNLITQPHPSLEHVWSIDWLIVVKPNGTNPHGLSKERKKGKYSLEPMWFQSNQTAQSAGKRGRSSGEGFQFRIWLSDRVARVFRTNHRAK